MNAVALHRNEGNVRLKLEGIRCSSRRSKDRIVPTEYDAVSLDGTFAVNASPRLRTTPHVRWNAGSFQDNTGLLVAWLGRGWGFDDNWGDRAEQIPTSSIGERIGNAYRCSPFKVIGRLTGQFVVAIWDPCEETLRLISDPVRSVPLYYCWDSERNFYFGNHAGQLARLSTVSADIDVDWLVSAVGGAAITEPNSTCLKNVRAVPGGSVLTVTDANVAISRYWRPRTYEPRADGAIVESFRERLFTRVGEIVNGYTSTTVALSGGLDSSALMRIAHHLAPSKVCAITNRVPGAQESDELHFARLALADSKVPLKVEVPSPDPCSVDVLREACEPSPAEWFPFIGAVARSARNAGSEVVLTGACGDVLGGFDGGWRDHYARISRWRGLFQATDVTDVHSLITTTASLARLWIGANLPNVTEIYRRTKSHAADGGRPKWPVHPSLEGTTQKDYMGLKQWRSLEEPRAILMQHYVDTELASMNRVSWLVRSVTGAELVHPFIDADIVAMAAVLPWALRRGPEGGRVLLRRATKGILPDEVRLRTTKCRYNVFYQRYFANSLQSQHFREGGRVLENLLSKNWDSMCRPVDAEMPYRRLAPIFRIGLIGAWLQAQGLAG